MFKKYTLFIACCTILFFTACVETPNTESVLYGVIYSVRRGTDGDISFISIGDESTVDSLSFNLPNTLYDTYDEVYSDGEVQIPSDINIIYGEEAADTDFLIKGSLVEIPLSSEYSSDKPVSTETIYLKHKPNYAIYGMIDSIDYNIPLKTYVIELSALDDDVPEDIYSNYTATYSSGTVYIPTTDNIHIQSDEQQLNPGELTEGMTILVDIYSEVISTNKTYEGTAEYITVVE